MVQACHAALQAGLKFKNPSKDPNSLIVIGLRDQNQLMKAIEDVQSKDIEVETFFEPDWDYGITAFATKPIHVDDKHLLKKYQCWRTK